MRIDSKKSICSEDNAPTLGSSSETRSSYGMYPNQYSDTSEYEWSSQPLDIPVTAKASSHHNKINRRPEIMSIQRNESLDDTAPLMDHKKHFGACNNFSDITSSSSSFLTSQSYDSLKNAKQRQSSLVTIFSVWNTIMGSSLLTMAWGVERAGLIPGILVMILMGGLCLFTSYTLLRVCYHHGDDAHCEVPDLCRMLLGRWAEIIAKIFSLIVLVGANIVYWILMANFLYYSVNYLRDLGYNMTTESTDLYGDVFCTRSPSTNMTLQPDIISYLDDPYWDLYSTVPVYLAVLIFPLLNFKSATFFTKFNSLGTLSVLYLILFVLIKSSGWGLHIDSWMEEIAVKSDFIVLSGMLALSFYIHNIIISVMRTNRNQENNGRDLSIAFVLVTITYILVGAVFYICFPLAKSCISDNILNNFDKSDALTAIARVLLLFQVLTVYPLIAFMLRKEVFGDPYKMNKATYTWYVMGFNLLLITVCILFACFVPKIGTIIRYTGALSGLVHIFTLPSLLQIMSLRKRGKLTVLKVVFYLLIFVIGACNLIGQFFVTD